MKEQKKQLRKQIKEAKKNQPAHVLAAHSTTLLEQLEQPPRFIASQTILLIIHWAMKCKRMLL